MRGEHNGIYIEDVMGKDHLVATPRERIVFVSGTKRYRVWLSSKGGQLEIMAESACAVMPNSANTVTIDHRRD